MVLLNGGVVYTEDEPLRQARGQAREATIKFDEESKPQPQRAVFTGGVHMIERTRASENGREPWIVRDLTAERFEATLTAGTGARAQLRTAEASGAAHLTVVNKGSLANASGEDKTEVSADRLRAVMVASAGAKPQLDTIAGRGHTLLHQVTAAGVDQSSTGDTLDAKFRPMTGISPIGNVSRPGSGTRTDTDFGVDRLSSSVQQGHVSMTRRTPARKAGTREDVAEAIADRAAFDGNSNRLTLTGGVRLTEVGNVLWANELRLDRATGDAHASGAVKVNYDSAPDRTGRRGAGTAAKPGQVEEPTHILADRVEMEKATDTATFYGKPVRLWQGASQIQAPVIELSRAQKRLIARGEGAGPQVHTSLASVTNDAANAVPAAGPAARCATTAKAGSAEASTATGPGASQVVRIASGGLTYSGITRQADFTGGIRADTVDATIRATQATGYLQDRVAQQKAADVTIPSLAGNLERVVASGHVDIAKPGLQATGDRLVYTASDRVFVLTGAKDAAAKAVNAQGTTTAVALRLQDSCEGSGGVSVEALGEVPGVPGQRVRTEARISSDRKREKAKQ